MQSAETQAAATGNEKRYDIAGPKGSPGTSVREATAGGLLEAGENGNYRLSNEFRDEIAPYYKEHFNYDVSKAEFEVLSPMQRSSSWGDEVTLGMNYMSGDDYQRRFDICHELTHSADAQAVGGPDALFDIRASQAAKYGESGQYLVPTTVEGRAMAVGYRFMYPSVSP